MNLPFSDPHDDPVGYPPQVAPAGYVEPLSTVSAGTLVEGRVTGVPAQVDWLVVHGWSMGGREIR